MGRDNNNDRPSRPRPKPDCCDDTALTSSAPAGAVTDQPSTVPQDAPPAHAPSTQTGGMPLEPMTAAAFGTVVLAIVIFILVLILRRFRKRKLEPTGCNRCATTNSLEKPSTDISNPVYEKPTPNEYASHIASSVPSVSGDGYMSPMPTVSANVPSVTGLPPSYATTLMEDSTRPDATHEHHPGRYQSLQPMEHTKSEFYTELQQAVKSQAQSPNRDRAISTAHQSGISASKNPGTPLLTTKNRYENMPPGKYDGYESISGQSAASMNSDYLQLQSDNGVSGESTTDYTSMHGPYSTGYMPMQ